MADHPASVEDQVFGGCFGMIAVIFSGLVALILLAAVGVNEVIS